MQPPPTSAHKLLVACPMERLSVFRGLGLKRAKSTVQFEAGLQANNGTTARQNVIRHHNEMLAEEGDSREVLLFQLLQAS